MTSPIDKQPRSESAPDTLEINLSLGLNDFSLQVNESLPLSGVTAIFGRSGSGKTTLLRCIAGFEQGEGSIRFKGRIWADSATSVTVPAYQRPVGYMFQQPGLFAHLNVNDNLDYAVKRAPQTQKQLQAGPELSPQLSFQPSSQLRKDDIVDAFALGALLKRSTTELSGGEAQRVALARTLLTQPQLLLLDEPMAALDDGHKAELLPYLETLVQNFDLPVLYVSHDVEEVARLASQMLVMDAGKVTAIGRTEALFERLDIADVSGRFESGALLDGQVDGHNQKWMLTRLRIAGQLFSIPLRPRLRPGDPVRLRIRARDVVLAKQKPEGLSIRNALFGKVRELQIDTATPFAEVVVELDTDLNSEKTIRLRARITRAAAAELELEPTMPIFALVKTVTLDT